MRVVVQYGLQTIAMTALLVCASASPAVADVCYLTTSGSSCGPAQTNAEFNAMGAIFQAIVSRPVGDVPLSMRSNGALPPGFNMTDQNGATHVIPGANVPIVSINNTNYRQFFLDMQETSGAPTLSLDKLQIFLGPTGSLNNYANGMLNGISPIYDLDNGIDSWVKLSYSLNPTGMGNMVAYIPNSVFTNLNTNPYVYLYAQFGRKNSSDGNFEEWWVSSPLAPSGGAASPNPEPAGIVLLGTGLVLAALRLRRKSVDDADKVHKTQTKVGSEDDFPPRVL